MRLWKNFSRQPACSIVRRSSSPILLAAGGVEHHAHLHAGARPFRQRAGHAPAQLALLPEEGLEVHGLARLRRCARRARRRSARSPAPRRALPRNGVPSVRPDERGHQLVDGRVALELADAGCGAGAPTRAPGPAARPVRRAVRSRNPDPWRSVGPWPRQLQGRQLSRWRERRGVMPAAAPAAGRRRPRPLRPGAPAPPPSGSRPAPAAAA